MKSTSIRIMNEEASRGKEIVRRERTTATPPVKTHHYLAFNFLKAPKRPNLEIQQVLKTVMKVIFPFVVWFGSVVDNERFSLS